MRVKVREADFSESDFASIGKAVRWTRGSWMGGIGIEAIHRCTGESCNKQLPHHWISFKDLHPNAEEPFRYRRFYDLSA